MIVFIPTLLLLQSYLDDAIIKEVSTIQLAKEVLILLLTLIDQNVGELSGLGRPPAKFFFQARRYRSIDTCQNTYKEYHIFFKPSQVPSKKRDFCFPLPYYL